MESSGLISTEREKPVFEFMASHGQWGSLQSCASGCDDTAPSSPAPKRTGKAGKGSMNLLNGRDEKRSERFLGFCLPRLGAERWGWRQRGSSSCCCCCCKHGCWVLFLGEVRTEQGKTKIGDGDGDEEEWRWNAGTEYLCFFSLCFTLKPFIFLLWGCFTPKITKIQSNPNQQTHEIRLTDWLDLSCVKKRALGQRER